MSRSYYVEPDHAEWSRLWGALYALTGDYDELHPVSGERWQYMGSVQVTGGQWVHQLRHRDRPRGLRGEMISHGTDHLITRDRLPIGRVYVNLFASPEFCLQRARIEAKPKACQDA